MTFPKWLDTYCSESDKVNPGHIFTVETSTQPHIIPAAVVIEAAKAASPDEQKFIRSTITKIDFANGDPMHFFKHLAECLARTHDAAA